MSEQSLQAKSIRAAAWTASEQVGRRLFHVAIGVVLARLLLPDDFGLIGILSVFIVVAMVFADGGLSAALIRNKDSTETDYSTAFFLNVVIGATVCVFLCMSSTLIASSFNEPRLKALTCFLSGTVFINSLGVVPATQFSKAINFRPMTTAILLSIAFSGAVGITLACCGFGVWSLAIQRLVADATRVGLYWSFSSWRPSFRFCRHSAASQLRFGSRVLGTAILNTLTQPLYYLVIARGHSPAVLGFVTQGTQLPDAPARTIAGLVNRVAFPVFSSIQDDPQRVGRGLQRALKTLFSTVFPFMVWLAVVATPLVSVLLTDKWLPCVPYLQLMCAIGILYPIQTLHQHLLMADGRARLLLRTQVLKILMHLLSLLVTFRLGVISILCGQIFVELVTTVLLSYVTGRNINYSLTQQMHDAAPSVGTAIVMCIAMAAVGTAFDANVWLLLASQTTAGLLVFGIMGNHLRLSPFVEVGRLLSRSAL